MEKIKATMISGGINIEIDKKFTSVKEAKKYFGQKVQIGKSVFCGTLGFIKIEYI